MTDDTLTVQEMDCGTGEITVRPMTQDEIDARTAAQVQARADADAQATADALAAASLQATNDKLLKMGLTQEDISNLMNAAKA